MKRLIIVAAVTAALLVSAARAEEDPFAWQWYQVDDDQQVEVNLFLFFRSTCPHCRDAVKFADELGDEHPWLVVKKYDIGWHSANLELYRRMASSMKRSAGRSQCDQDWAEPRRSRAEITALSGANEVFDPPRSIPPQRHCKHKSAAPSGI